MKDFLLYLLSIVVVILLIIGVFMMIDFFYYNRDAKDFDWFRVRQNLEEVPELRPYFDARMKDGRLTIREAEELSVIKEQLLLERQMNE